jgi:leucyl-tRNA synthetase
MVCHETYKDQKNNWLYPDEVTSKDGKNFYKKMNSSEKIIVGASESMSKSKKNTIDPEEIIKNYGADAVRLFVLSDSPPEKDVQWSDQGMVASYKFIQKFWIMHEKIKIKYLNENIDKSEFFDEQIEEFTNQIIHKINLNLEKFSYNVIIANLHEIYNFFLKKIEGDKIYDNLLKNYEKILKIMLPLTPHLATECLDQISDNSLLKWPIVNEKYLKTNEVNIVIQIDGKKRSVIRAKIDLEEEEIKNIVFEIEELKKFWEDKKIIKTIFVKNKILNLIIK